MIPRSGRGRVCVASAVPVEQARLWAAPPPYSEPDPTPVPATVDGIPVLRLCTGIGPDRSAEVVRRCFAEYPVRGLLFVGFAGGLEPGLGVGDVIWVDGAFSADGRFLSLPRTAARNTTTARRANVLSVSRVVATAPDKGALYARWRTEGVVAVDMESYAIASAAADHGVDCVILRAVSDPAERDLPAAALRATSPRGAIRFGALARECLRRPAALAELTQLGLAARRASRGLAAAARAVLRAQVDWTQ